jgi:hypothetical protein
MKPPRNADSTTLELASFRSIVAALWITAGFLSVLFAPEVSAWIVHDAWLSK